MLKYLSIITVITTLILSQINPILAKPANCKYYCEKPIEFAPGKSFNVEIINLSSNLIEMEKVANTDIMVINPGQIISLRKITNTINNSSFVFWDVNNIPLQIKIIQLDSQTLRIELHHSERKNISDRSVYIQDNGRVLVF